MQAETGQRAAITAMGMATAPRHIRTPEGMEVARQNIPMPAETQARAAAVAEMARQSIRTLVGTEREMVKRMTEPRYHP